MFTNSNVEQITVETNRYMNEKSPNNKDVITSDDIKSVYGILIYMSVIKLPKMQNYFSGRIAQQQVCSAIKVSKFEKTVQNLHFCDNKMAVPHGEARLRQTV